MCKIIIEEEVYGTKANKKGSGFFMEVDNKKKYIITAEHFINQNNTYEIIQLEIYNGKKIKLNLKERDINYFPRPKDIAIIELKDTDEICNEIKFLSYDTNYSLGYNIYKNGYVFTIGYPRGGKAICSSGQIKEIKNYQFIHNIPTFPGSAGCPIMLLNKNINEIRVIGIDAGSIVVERDNKKMNFKFGTFIAEITQEKIEEQKKIDSGDCIIQFITTDQKTNTFISCKITDSFSVLEEKLFNDFPNLKNKNIFF